MRFRSVLLPLFLFAANAAVAQTNPPLPIYRGAPSVLAQDANVQVYHVLIVPVVSDTNAALSYGVDSLGMIIQIRTTGIWYKRDTMAGGHFWNQISVGGGSGGSDSGFQVLYAPLSGVPIAKYVDGSGNRFILYDTTGSHPGAMGTNAGIQKKIDSLSGVINGLLSAKFGLTDTGYTKTLASVFTLGKVRDSLAAVFNVGLGTKYSSADTGYTRTLASVFTLAKVRDSLASLISLRRLISDTSGTNSTATRGYVGKVRDSLGVLIGSGGGGATLTFGTGLQSGSYTGGAAKTVNVDTITMATRNALDSAVAVGANYTIYNQGSSGHGLLRGSTDTFYSRLLRDSGDFHLSSPGDSALVGYVNAHDTVVLQSKYRSDTGRTNVYAALAGKQASGSYLTAPVANSSLSSMSATTIKGAVSAGTPQDLTPAQVAAMLPVATNSAKGLAPQLPNDATKYLDGTGNYSIPAGGGGGGISQLYTNTPALITIGGTDTANFLADSMATKVGLMPLNVNNHQTVNGGLLWSYDNTWSSTSSNNYQATNITATLSGGKVQLSSSAGTFLPMYSKLTLSYLEHWSKIDTVVINSTPSSTTYGLWNGIGSATFGCENCGFVDLSTGANAGKISVVTNDTLRVTSATAITFASGDTVITTFSQASDTLSFIVTDKATSSTVNLSYVVANTFTQGSGDILHSTSYYAIGVKGGTYTLVASRITNLERVNVPLAWVGDSKFFGDFAGSLSARAGTMLNANYAATDMFGSAGDNIGETLSRINDIIAIHPQMAILETYCNDLRQGHSLAQTISDFQHLYSYLEGNGIKVYVVTAPEVILASIMAQFDSAVRILYPDTYIPVYDALSACGSPCMASDGIHWTARGNDSVYNVIVRSGKISRSTYLPSFARGAYYSGLSQEKVASDLNLWRIGGNPDVAGIGSAGYSTIGIPGTSANLRFDWDYNRRITLNRALASAAYMTFGSQTGGSWGDVYLDSLSNVGLGYNNYSGGNPTQYTNTRIGYEAGYNAAMNSSNTTMIGAYAGSHVSFPTLANNIFIGYKSGYYETNPWRFYLAMNDQHTILFGDSSRLVVHDPPNGTSPLTFPTNDNFQVVGSEYVSDSLVVNNIRDGSSLDSTALLTQIAPGKFVLHKGAPAAGATFASGSYVPTITGISSVTSATADSAVWSRNGSVVTVSGHVNITPAANNTSTVISITLPVTSLLNGQHACWGTGSTSAGNGSGVLVTTYSTNHIAQLIYTAGSSAGGVPGDFYYTFQYQVQ